MRSLNVFSTTAPQDEHISGSNAWISYNARFEADDQVCSIYDLLLKAPAGQTIAVPMVDWITLRDGRIAAQKLYYDPREMMLAFGM